MWKGKIYAFQSDLTGLDQATIDLINKHFYFVRKQSNEQIPVTDPKAGNMIGFTEQDLDSFMNTYVVNGGSCQ